QLMLKAKLNSLIAIPLQCLDLKDRTRASFNHSHRNDRAIVAVNLCHSDFSSEKPDGHGSSPQCFQHNLTENHYASFRASQKLTQNQRDFTPNRKGSSDSALRRSLKLNV